MPFVGGSQNYFKDNTKIGIHFFNTLLVKRFAHLNMYFFLASLEERGKLWKWLLVSCSIMSKVSPPPSGGSQEIKCAKLLTSTVHVVIQHFSLYLSVIFSDAWLNSIMSQIYFQSNLNLFSAGSLVQTLIQGRIICIT